jgi:hypothetical protein
MQSMKGATKLLSGMNRQMNLPALQRIAMEFERETDIMDQRQEMMDDAIDDVTGLEDEEEGEEVVNQVLDEIGIDLGQAVSNPPYDIHTRANTYSDGRDPDWPPKHRRRARQSRSSHWRRSRRRRSPSQIEQSQTMRSVKEWR